MIKQTCKGCFSKFESTGKPIEVCPVCSTDIPLSATCNKCGGSCQPPGCQDNYGLINARVETGYFSPVLDDDFSIYTFSICEKCVAETFDSFLIPPEVFCF
jgi:hypothetical protein